MSPPALIPTTLQPWHGSAITVESDAYRPLGSPVQLILFSSNRLDPTETYTITVSKTNATLNSDVNIDAFILTQPDGADLTTSSPGIYISESTLLSASNAPLPSFVAQTTVISGTTHSGPVVSLGATSSGYSAQTSSVTNAHNIGTSINAGAIAGGVIGGIVAGITIMFFATRWWLRRGQGRGGPDGLPILPLSDETPHPVYFNTMVATYPSPVRISPLTQNPVQVKTRYTGNGQPNNFLSATSLPAPVVSAPVVSSPEDTRYNEPTLPAYSQN